MSEKNKHQNLLQSILGERLEAADVRLEDLDWSKSLVDYGIIDSLQITELLLSIEESTGGAVDYDALDFDTIFYLNGLADIIDGALNG
jgi:acyl carrier protein